MSYIFLPPAGSAYFKDPVMTLADLPLTDQEGTVRLVVDEGQLYWFDGATWLALGGTFSVSDTDSIDLTFTAGTLSADLRISADAPDANNRAVALNIQSGGSPGLRAQITDANIRSVLSATTPIGYNSTTGVISLSGVVPIANGGTNSATALNNNRVMVSSTGAIVEAAAITASRALESDANGIPVASSVTATELGYVSGVTSSIQTQLNAKEPTIAAGTTADYWRGDKTFQTLQVSAMTAATNGAAAATGAIGEILTATQASNTSTGVGSTGAWGAATSVSLTAGVWQITGVVGFHENSAVLTTGLQCGISDSATGVAIDEFQTTLAAFLVSGTSDALIPVTPLYISISTTTSYYLNTKFTYTSGTPQHRGKITAIRIR